LNHNEREERKDFMVAGAVESVTTYEPYGNLLARPDASGTVYGFTR
jgi:hypothetical protein